MKKLFRLISIFLTAILLLCAVGCSFDDQNKQRLDTPVVTIAEDGTASWEAVDNADYYVYVIDEGEQTFTFELKVQLNYNESIKVKAVSGDGSYRDSKYSQYKTYIGNSQSDDDDDDNDDNKGNGDNTGDDKPIGGGNQDGDDDNTGDDNQGGGNGNQGGGNDKPVVGPELSAEVKAYYNKITATSGNTLLGQVHDLITTTHTYYTSYDDCKNTKYIYLTDPGPNGGALEFYTQKSVMSFSGNPGTWNREHVWCKSLSNGMWKSVSGGTRSGGSDMHHIRPAEGSLNSTRSSYKFGEANGGKEAWSKDTSKGNVAVGGHIGGGAFEPLDNVKGDVARIVMYVYTHYNTYANVYGTTNGSQSGVFGELKFTHVMAPTSEAAAIKLLLEWNASDPVDDIEIRRNNEVYKIQGNRNPFIDHPEYANAIWG